MKACGCCAAANSVGPRASRPALSSRGDEGRAWRCAVPKWAVSRAEKLPQCLRRLLRLLLGEEMAAIDGKAGHFARTLLPSRDDAGPFRDGPAAPDREHRAFDLLRDIGLVVIEIDRGAGAVVFAGGVDR